MLYVSHCHTLRFGTSERHTLLWNWLIASTRQRGRWSASWPIAGRRIETRKGQLTSEVDAGGRTSTVHPAHHIQPSLAAAAAAAAAASLTTRSHKKAAVCVFGYSLRLTANTTCADRHSTQNLFQWSPSRKWICNNFAGLTATFSVS